MSISGAFYWSERDVGAMHVGHKLNENNSAYTFALIQLLHELVKVYASNCFKIIVSSFCYC